MKALLEPRSDAGSSRRAGHRKADRPIVPLHARLSKRPVSLEWSTDAPLETTLAKNEQIAWMLEGKMEFRLGSEQRVCGQGDVVVIPGGTEHEAWFREDSEVIDFFAPRRDDFLLGGKPAYMSEG